LGAVAEARNILRYLIATSTPKATGRRTSGSAASRSGAATAGRDRLSGAVGGRLAERGALDGVEVRDMVRRALVFIARNGPATEQDRWRKLPA